MLVPVEMSVRRPLWVVQLVFTSWALPVAIGSRLGHGPIRGGVRAEGSPCWHVVRAGGSVARKEAEGMPVPTAANENRATGSVSMFT